MGWGGMRCVGVGWVKLGWVGGGVGWGWVGLAWCDAGCDVVQAGVGGGILVGGGGLVVVVPAAPKVPPVLEICAPVTSAVWPCSRLHGVVWCGVAVWCGVVWFVVFEVAAWCDVV